MQVLSHTFTYFSTYMYIREVCGLAIASPHTSLHQKQRTQMYDMLPQHS
jgi:hypothetical protein